MKSQVNKFIGAAARAWRLKSIAATLGLAIVCLDCSAQSMQQITVQGKDSSWRLVGTVDPLTAFQIGARGNVDFGGLGENDDPNAGVTGNQFAKYARDIFSGGIAELIPWLESVFSSGDGSGIGDSAEALSTTNGMHWNWVDYINANGSTVNYDEGAFFVVMTTTSQPPSKGSSANEVAQPALYYWYKKVFDNGANVAFDQKVWVWVKVHDGGHDPFSTASFGDNHGAYTIWIDPDQQINDTAQSVHVALPAFNNTAAAMRLRAQVAASSHGKPVHLVTVLKRKQPNRQPA